MRSVSFLALATHWVLRVKAALVMDVGRFRPLVISLQIFLLMISTRPPFSVTSLYSMYRSRICLAIMGIRLIGVPVIVQEREGYVSQAEQEGVKSVHTISELDTKLVNLRSVI